MKENFTVTGMTCAACSAHVEKSVRALAGVDNVAVNLLQNSMVVEYRENVSPLQIVSAVQSAGYGASVKSNCNGKTTPINPLIEQYRQMKIRLAISVFFLVPLMYVSMGHMLGVPMPAFLHGAENAMSFALTQFFLTLPVVYVNRVFFISGTKAIFRKAPNMDSLIAIGTAAAIVYGIAALYGIGRALGVQDMATVSVWHMDLYFESAATILTLITVGKMLEARSKGKTSEAIEKLMDLSPKTATVIRGETEVEIPIDEVVVGDVIVVRPGASVPVDGVIVEGNSVLDESALTGESLPVEKTIGGHVTGATINRSGFFKFRAERVGQDTTLAQIIALVQDANTTKAPIARLADKVSGVFVPIVIGIAVITAIVWLFLGYGFSVALSNGIAVLVISCPCALGLATPTAIMVGTGKAAENGILVKSAEALESLKEVNAVILDKTGTVTQGKPHVTNIITNDNLTENELLRLAASLEAMSEHPLAQAIVEEATTRGISVESAQRFKAVAGRGIGGVVGDISLFGGNKLMMQELGVNIEDVVNTALNFAGEGKTPLFFSDGKKLLGIIALADRPKPTSREAIRQLESMGKEVLMLTGDNAETAAAIGREMGIKRIVAGVMPQDKEAEVRRVQAEGKKVAMVGDGINDAPALARADVGIAIGAGVDIAIESADIVLMRSDLMDVAGAIRLSQTVIRNIKQNLFWAFFYNVIGIPLAAGLLFIPFGMRLNPMFAAAAMSMSSFCVVMNALRLRFAKPIKASATEYTEEQPLLREEAMLPKNKININMEEKALEKIMIIEGMSCGHCSARVEQVLNTLAGVTSSVNLEAKTATVTLAAEVADDVLRIAVENAGYKVVGIR